MKRVWIACAILLFILAGTLYHSFYLNSFVCQLTDILEQAEQEAWQDNWDEAGALTQTAHEKWDSHETYLHILLPHSETDAVYTSFREVKQFIQGQEPEEYFAANSCLISELELLAEAEQLCLKNVF